MITAHYINPFISQNDVEFHLLLLLNNDILERSVCSFKRPLSETVILEHTTNVVNNFCEQYNLNKQPEELGLDPTFDLKYDLPQNFESLQ